MQSKWGPRLFWLVVFVLAALGVYVMFGEPAEDLGQVGYSSALVNMVSIHPKLGGCEIELGVKDRTSSDWKGSVKLNKGKILQFYVVQGNSASVTAGTRFDCKSNISDEGKQPVVLRLTYLADADDTLNITVGNETQAIPLADLQKQPSSLFSGNVNLRSQVPQQIYENDSQTDDLQPVLTRDSKGNDYLLYLNVEHSKGIDVNGVLNGSFESLENPVVNVSLRLSRFHDGSWQYSEAVTPKLESCIEPAVAIDNDGRIYVAWLQKDLEGWDIHYCYKDEGVTWSKPAKLTKKTGAYQQLVAGTDSKGKVWLAWQTWQESFYDIHAAVINDDKHLFRTPGPVAERSRELDGRWFPSMAADKLGNMYIAWSVFRQGHFDIEVMKLYDNMVKSKPIELNSVAQDAIRPSLACDRENQLWIANEESGPVTNFGDAHLPLSQIRVRTLTSDGKTIDWPLLSTPVTEKRLPVADKKPIQEGRCTHPHIIFSPEGGPLVTFQSNQRLYSSRLEENGWSAGKLLSEWQPAIQTSAPSLYQAGHIVGIHESLDFLGRVRLTIAAAIESTTAFKSPAKLPASLPSSDVSNWKPFSELARQFRKRSDDLVLNKRYLLRGLVLLPNGVATMGNDPWGLSALALEQAYYDWIMIPHDTRAPISQQWMNAQRAHAINQQSDRNFLLGYYRPLVGQREPLLHIDTKKDEWPLPALANLDFFRKPTEKVVRINVTEATDRSMVTQYVNQRQRLGFSLTDDWKLLPALTQPGNAEAYSNSIERLLVPLWHPEVTPITPSPSALRVVAMANGKSYDQLLDSLRERHFYVATDDIYLLVRCDKHLPGDIFQSYFKPTINVLVQGTGKLKAVEIWQDNKLIKSEEPPGQAAILEYSNSQPDRQWHSYTVRVVQENGAQAIAQPFWIRFIP